MPRFPYVRHDAIGPLVRTIQLSEVNGWFLNHYQIKFFAGTGFEWQAIVTDAACIEHMLREYCFFKSVRLVDLVTLSVKSKLVSENTKFNSVIEALYAAKEISITDRVNLHVLREMRNGLHLHKMFEWRHADPHYRRYKKQKAFFEYVEKKLLNGFLKTVAFHICNNQRCLGVDFAISTLTTDSEYLPNGVYKQGKSYIHKLCGTLLSPVQSEVTSDHDTNLSFDEEFDENTFELEKMMNEPDPDDCFENMSVDDEIEFDDIESDAAGNYSHEMGHVIE